MFYQSELDFLCATLKKSHVRTLIFAEGDAVSWALSEEKTFGREGFFRELEPYTLYQLTDALDRTYRYFLLPETRVPTLFLMGPDLTARPTRERLLELGEKRGVSPAHQARFAEYYAGLVLLSEGHSLFLMLSTFCERVFQKPAFAIVNINGQDVLSVSPLGEMAEGDRLDEAIINMRTMEKRYAFENELIRSVTLGQLHKESELLTALSGEVFERRLDDPLRNAKNYGIIMNTLLRKAAEQGGVHPVYLDRVSSEFAARIEHMAELSESYSLMREMFRAYCRLVRRHAIMHYSLAVQRTILLIDSDLSADLSLKTLAENQNISPGYLSTVFRRDTGKTLSEYIRDKRIRHAEHLLATTHLQVQTVAQHCGIMDVQYFSKIFKKHTGKTPKAYRESLKRSGGL